MVEMAIHGNLSSTNLGSAAAALAFSTLPKRATDETRDGAAMGERRAKRTREAEYKEYNKILLGLDHEDERDLAAHLHLAHEYRKAHQNVRRQGRRRKDASPTSKSKGFSMRHSWTTWPLPAKAVPRPDPIPNTFTQSEDTPCAALHGEIESCLLRLAKERITADNQGVMRADEGAPYRVTQEATRVVMNKLDRLLHSLGRMKFQQLNSETARKRSAASKWDEIVGIAGISECIASAGAMERVVKRCNKLFKEDIKWEAV